MLIICFLYTFRYIENVLHCVSRKIKLTPLEGKRLKTNKQQQRKIENGYYFSLSFTKAKYYAMINAHVKQ